MEQFFSGKVVLVTGAASGNGQETALLFAAQGAKVIVADNNINGGYYTVAKIKNLGGEATFIDTDVSTPEDCEELVKQTIATYHRIDIACNSAGILEEPNGLADMSIEEWHHVINTNLNGIFYSMKYEIKAMSRQGRGVIVNIPSILTVEGFASFSASVAAKHAVVALTQNAAIEYSGKGIRINAIGTAPINTQLLVGRDGRMKEPLMEMHPKGNQGNTKDVAELVIWLCSDKASSATGGYYPIDGTYISW